MLGALSADVTLFLQTSSTSAVMINDEGHPRGTHRLKCPFIAFCPALLTKLTS